MDDLNKVKFALKRDIEQNNENVNKQLLIFLNGIIGTNHDDEDDSKAPPESPNTRKVLSEMFDEKERQNSKDFKETRLALQTNYENRASTKELKQANILKADIVIASTLHSKQNELEKNQKKDLLSKGMRNRSESKELSERGILHNNGMADSLQSNANKLHQQQKKDKLKAAIDNRASSKKELAQKGIIYSSNIASSLQPNASELEQKLLKLEQFNALSQQKSQEQKETIYKLRDVIQRKENQLQQIIQVKTQQTELLNKEEKDESDEDIQRLIRVLMSLNNEIVAFKVNFNQMNVEEIGDSDVNEVVDANSAFNQKLEKYAQIIGAIDICCRNFKESVVAIQDFVQNKFIPKTEQYENWSLDEIMLWINWLEHGRFNKYLKRLQNAFLESDILIGAELPDLSTADLSVTPFNIKIFRDKRDLIKHFKSLRSGLSVKHIATKRRNSESLFHPKLIGTESKDTNDVAEEIFLEHQIKVNSQQYVD